MKLFKWCKDGGPDSNVDGFFLVELKRLLSIALLRFGAGSREAYHSHAFNSVSWLVGGVLVEHHKDGTVDVHYPSLLPILTHRNTFHKVKSVGTSWVFTLRGPWVDKWKEYFAGSDQTITLTHGRVRSECH